VGSNGPVGELRLGRRALVVADPGDFHHVLASNAANYEKAPRLLTARGRRIAGAGVFTAETAEARRLRRPIKALLHGREVAAVVDTAVDAADELVASWPAGEAVDLAVAVEQAARRAMLRGVLGALSSEEESSLGEGVEVRRRVMERALARVVPVPRAVPIAVLPERRRAVSRLDATLAAIVQARRGNPQDDVVSLLLHAGRPLEDERAREELLGLALTGYMTIGRAVTWTLVELLSDPELEAAVRDEAAGAPTLPRAADVPSLELGGACLAEGLRLHPPTPSFVRVARRADRLPSGTHVPAGRLLFIFPYAVQRDPRWFPEPDRFRPQRFLAGRDSWPAFAYLPFGAGPRVCIGRTLAAMESTLLVARILGRWRLELLGPANPAAARSFGTAAPGTVRVGISPA
jgi:cytochrome P450